MRQGVGCTFLESLHRPHQHHRYNGRRNFSLRVSQQYIIPIAFILILILLDSPSHPIISSYPYVSRSTEEQYHLVTSQDLIDLMLYCRLEQRQIFKDHISCFLGTSSPFGLRIVGVTDGSERSGTEQPTVLQPRAENIVLQ
jgi:hypothetical protein